MVLRFVVWWQKKLKVPFYSQRCAQIKKLKKTNHLWNLFSYQLPTVRVLNFRFRSIWPISPSPSLQCIGQNHTHTPVLLCGDRLLCVDHSCWVDTGAPGSKTAEIRYPRLLLLLISRETWSQTLIMSGWTKTHGANSGKLILRCFQKDDGGGAVVWGRGRWDTFLLAATRLEEIIVGGVKLPPENNPNLFPLNSLQKNTKSNFWSSGKRLGGFILQPEV